ncbi:hypothetical protein ATF84_12814 [[Clostridium] innocuum]|nr:hypothetical protein ATF84_12814 [[Clostridium] innocuum]SSA49497.1 hypothetical protein SAMN04487929_12814 [[Clostridium] innocuum]
MERSKKLIKAIWNKSDVIQKKTFCFTKRLLPLPYAMQSLIIFSLTLLNLVLIS